MTHATNLFIKEPAKPEVVWGIAVDVLASYSDYPASSYRWTTGAKDGNGHYHGHIGQGYASMLAMTYADDAPVERREWHWNEDTNEGWKTVEDLWSFKFDFDTGYGFNGRGGLGCVELHERMSFDIINAMAAEFKRSFSGIFDNEMIGRWFAISSDSPDLNLFK